MRPTNKCIGGTHFQYITVIATLGELRKIFGEPEYEEPGDKTGYQFVAETDDGDVFSVYDRLEYRKLEEDEAINWHIGSHSKEISEKAKAEIIKIGVAELPKKQNKN